MAWASVVITIGFDEVETCTHTESPSPHGSPPLQTEVFHLALFVTVTPVFRPPAVPSAIGLPGDESRSANPVLKYLGRVVLPSEPGSGRGGLPAGEGGAPRRGVMTS